MTLDLVERTSWSNRLTVAFIKFCKGENSIAHVKEALMCFVVEKCLMPSICVTLACYSQEFMVVGYIFHGS